MKFVVRSSLVAAVFFFAAVILCFLFSDAQARDPRMGFDTEFGTVVGGEPGEDPHYRWESVKVPYCDSPPLGSGVGAGAHRDGPYAGELPEFENSKLEVSRSRLRQRWMIVLRVVLGNVIR
jgi:hypothetical protein